MNWRPARNRDYSPQRSPDRPATPELRLCLTPQELESVHLVPTCSTHPNTLPVPTELVVMRPAQRYSGLVTVPTSFHNPCAARHPEAHHSRNVRSPGAFHSATQTTNRTSGAASDVPTQQLSAHQHIEFSQGTDSAQQAAAILPSNASVRPDPELASPPNKIPRFQDPSNLSGGTNRQFTVPVGNNTSLDPQSSAALTSDEAGRPKDDETKMNMIHVIQKEVLPDFPFDKACELVDELKILGVFTKNHFKLLLVKHIDELKALPPLWKPVLSEYIVQMTKGSIDAPNNTTDYAGPPAASVEMHKPSISHITAGTVVEENATTDIRMPQTVTGNKNTGFEIQPGGRMDADFRGATFNIGSSHQTPNSPANPGNEDSMQRSHSCTTDLADKFVQICNDYSRKETKDEVRSSSKSLASPKRQVNPGYKITDYYRGDTCLESSKYRPDSLYIDHTKRINRGKKVELHQFLEKSNYVALIGDAGSGKTTTAKRFAQRVLDKRIPSLNNIKLVLFVRIAELDCGREMTAFDLIFAQTLGAKLTDDIKDCGRHWVQKNSESILLVLDGLDQANWKLEDKTISIAYDQSYKAPIVFHNILNKDLFPGCKILMTCREHAIKDCPSSIRPKITIALVGLALKDRDYLIQAFGGEKGQDVLNHLKTKSPGLLSICQTPVFLVFTVAVVMEDLENAPDTITGILIRVLVHFLCSEHRRVENIKDVFRKLMELGFKGTMEKRVLFQMEELLRLAFNPAEINDLVIITPCKDLPNLGVIVKEFHNVFFCHQSIQETFAALKICLMPADKFDSFIWNHFDDPHISVVRLIVLGIFFHPSVDVTLNKPVIGNIVERTEKVNSLKGWLEKVFKNRGKHKRQRDKNLLNLSSANDDILIRLLYECGDGIDGILKQHLRSVKINRVLEGNILHMTTSVMSRCSSISAEFVKITLRSGDVVKFVKALDPCISLKVDLLQVTEISDQEQLLAVLINKSHKDGSKAGVEAQVTKSHVFQMKEFDLSNNYHLDYTLVGKLIQVCNVEKLHLPFRGTTLEQVKEMMKELGEAKNSLKIKYRHFGQETNLSVDDFTMKVKEWDEKKEQGERDE